MARKQEVIVTLVDDIDGTEAVETVSFALDGVGYEIDLNKKNAKALRTDVEKWVESARKARKTPTGRRRTAAKTGGSDAAAIRVWAHENGIAVPARGRIPAAIVEQYRSA